MHTSSETGLIGVWSSQSIIVRVGVGGGPRVGVTQLHSDSPFFYCLHHTPNRTIHASKVELILFPLYNFFVKIKVTDLQNRNCTLGIRSTHIVGKQHKGQWIHFTHNFLIFSKFQLNPLSAKVMVKKNLSRKTGGGEGGNLIPPREARGFARTPGPPCHPPLSIKEIAFIFWCILNSSNIYRRLVINIQLFFRWDHSFFQG